MKARFLFSVCMLLGGTGVARAAGPYGMPSCGDPIARHPAPGCAHTACCGAQGRAGCRCPRPIDVVICLDTSGSMEGLINSARAKLWDIVNEYSRVQPTPRLRVGLLTYGSPVGSSASRGWIVRQSELTTDLDGVYAKLMALSTSGGDEYVGWVLHEAIERMNWSCDPRAVKMLFVAGNESADQGIERHNFRYEAERARGRGMIINSIYAGGHEQGRREAWDQVAQHGGGCYSAIDMARGVAQISTPFDAELLRLNNELNATYLPYGEEGRIARANQLAQDKNAEAMGQHTAASRARVKGGAAYDNAHWDLVDAVAQKKVEVESLPAAALPAPLREVAPAERAARVEQMRGQRAEVQRRIQDVGRQRDAFLEEARQQQGGEASGLDDAIRVALRKQLEAQGFRHE